MKRHAFTSFAARSSSQLLHLPQQIPSVYCFWTDKAPAPIYFNSDRGGNMQIWRMRPDGSGPEQVTSDDLVNWTPHISPDGKSIVFLSYEKGVTAINVPSWAPGQSSSRLRLLSDAPGCRKGGNE